MAQQQAKVQRLINNSKGLRYVGGFRIMPDAKGVEVTSEQLIEFKKNPAFAARLESGEFEVK